MRGSNCSDLTGKILVFWIGGRLRECFLIEARLYHFAHYLIPSFVQYSIFWVKKIEKYLDYPLSLWDFSGIMKQVWHNMVKNTNW